jgi:hypothetical protein
MIESICSSDNDIGLGDFGSGIGRLPAQGWFAMVVPVPSTRAGSIHQDDSCRKPRTLAPITTPIAANTAANLSARLRSRSNSQGNAWCPIFRLQKSAPGATVRANSNTEGISHDRNVRRNHPDRGAAVTSRPRPAMDLF